MDEIFFVILPPNIYLQIKKLITNKKFLMMKKTLLIGLLGLLTAGSVQAQRVTDKLNRGLVAIPQGDKDGQDANYGTSGSGIFVTWRILPSEYYDTKYNLYRGTTKVNSEPLSVSNFQDNAGTKSSKYSVVPVINGQERKDLQSKEVTPWNHQYWDIPVAKVLNRNGVDVTSGYTLNDCAVADVDGDGEMEFVVKRRNDSGNLRKTSNKTDFNRHECYKLDGTLLWYIDMGPNLMAGPDEQFDLILYDWDGDGKAEALMRGADNMIIHAALNTDSPKTINIGDMTYDNGGSYEERAEYTHDGAEYILYMDGATGKPFEWDGQNNWTPQAYPLPRLEKGESDYTVWGSADSGHRSCKHYFGAPYLDGRNPSIFLGRGCYTRHKFCALDVDKTTHKLTQRWRWNCYDSKSPWYGNGFHNYAIGDVDMDGRDEIIFGSMIIDDTGFGLATTGFGHGDAQHCTDLDPYRWGMEQFVCLEGLSVPGIAYTDATSQTLYYSNGTGGDNGRCMAGNFQNTYPGAIGISGGVISLVTDRLNTNLNINGDDYVNARIYWDGDLLDEFMDSPGVERAPCVYKAPGQNEVHSGRSYKNGRCFLGAGNLNNSSKNNACFLGDIIGDWREEIVVRTSTAIRIYTSSYESPWGMTSLWYDHVYRNGMCWQPVGYNQPPHTSFFVGELEGITNCPPALTLEDRVEVENGGTITTTTNHLLISGYEDKTISVAADASPYILTVNAPAWVKGSGGKLSSDVITADASTPKQPTRTIVNYTTTLTGGAFSGTTRLVKQGEGVLVLPNVVEKHTGETSIWNGVLQFDGTFESSPLWLNRHTALISNGGQFKAGVKAEYNATIYPGGKDQVGTLTVSQLDLAFGARVVFDLNGSEADQLNVTKLTLEYKGNEDVWANYGPKYKAPVVQIVSGSITAGKYQLGTIGSVEGQVDEVTVEGVSGMRSFLTYEDGKLYLNVEQLHAPAALVWNGTAESDRWDFGITKNFLNNGVADYAGYDDDVIFNDDAAQTTVTVKGAVQPKTVVFNNTKAYTLNGDSIVGGPTVTKNGKGTLTINSINHTGATIINEGTLVVNMLANNMGQTYGSLGDASKRITIADGATLRANGAIKTDQPFSISGTATIDVPSGKNLILNNSVTGVGATLVKTGAGSLQTGMNNTFQKLILKQGSVTPQESNAVMQVPDTIELQGGTFYDFADINSYSTNRANLVVPKNKTATFYGDPRCTYTGSLKGAGTLNIYGTGPRCYYDGDWSEFEGTIVPGLSDRSVKGTTVSFDFRHAKGLPKATLKLNKDFTFYNQVDMEIGAVTGSGSLAGSYKYILGGKNDDFFFDVNCSSPIIKRGTGKMILMTAGNVSGALTVEEGALAFDDAIATDLLTGNAGVSLTKKGQIEGVGYLSSITATDSAQVSPIGYLIGTPGLLKVMGVMNMGEATTTNFLLNSTSEYSNLSANFLYLGKVNVTLGNGFQPKVGDSFTLWKARRVLRDPVEINLPSLPEGLYWNTSSLLGQSATGVLTVTDNPADGIGIIPADAEAKCQVFGMSGVMMTTMHASRNQLLNALKAMRVKPGLYIVKMQLGSNQTTETVIVK